MFCFMISKTKSLWSILTRLFILLDRKKKKKKNLEEKEKVIHTIKKVESKIEIE